MSENVSKITIKEAQLIQNIINKLNVYMEQNGQTLFSLAQTMGFVYQPFNRLMKNKTVPSLSSLAMISDYLNCSISELINDEFFIDINLVTSMTQLPEIDSVYKRRIYIPYGEFKPLLNQKFFILSDSANDIISKVYYLTDHIISDGEFIVIYKKKHLLMNVLLSSSKFILIQNGNKEERISTEEIIPIAKFFKNTLMCDSNNNQIRNSII
ncbi:MAG: helix-turn-helix transcriptional regulator [Burkholderiales bacterium]|nr:helix-turn-helix transcriptional regulator [Burkholderiales bacterium]